MIFTGREFTAHESRTDCSIPFNVRLYSGGSMKFYNTYQEYIDNDEIFQEWLKLNYSDTKVLTEKFIKELYVAFDSGYRLGKNNVTTKKQVNEYIPNFAALE